MGKNYVYVKTALHKDKSTDEYVIDDISMHITAFSDLEHFMICKFLEGRDNIGYGQGVWRGPKYGDRVGFDTSKQIGKSHAETSDWGFHVRVFELYENPED